MYPIYSNWDRITLGYLGHYHFWMIFTCPTLDLCKKMLDTNAGLCYNAPRSQELQHVGEWCNGSTCDSDSYSPGSSPGSPALLPPLSSGLGRRPLKAETPVRIWLEVVRYDLVVRSFFFILFSPFHPRLHSCTIGRDYS